MNMQEGQTKKKISVEPDQQSTYFDTLSHLHSYKNIFVHAESTRIDIGDKNLSYKLMFYISIFH